MNTVSWQLQNSYGIPGGLHTRREAFVNAPVQNSRTAKNVSNKKRMLQISERASQGGATQDTMAGGIFQSTQNYGELLRTQRQQAKATSLKLKKLKYHFKDISTRIIRSKTSRAARQVAGQARREVLRLKREKQKGSYASEEIEAAIVHAKAMERVAKKKVKHLEEEEMAKVSGGLCAGSLMEEEAEKSEQTSETETEEMPEKAPEETSEIPEEISEILENTTEMLEDLSESMQELLEEFGLEELTEELAAGYTEIDQADLKEMKIKHRNKEMKDIIKADADYLKAIFDYLEKSAASGAGASGAGTSGAAASGAAASGAGAICPAPVIDVTL